MCSEAVRQNVKVFRSFLTSISYWSLMELCGNTANDVLRAKFSHQAHCCRTDVRNWKAVVIARIYSLLEVCESAFTCWAIWKLSEQNGRQELVIDWTSLRKPRAFPLMPTHMAFQGEVLYCINTAQNVCHHYPHHHTLHTHTHTFTPLSVTESKLYVQIGHLRPQKNMSAWNAA